MASLDPAAVIGQLTYETTDNYIFTGASTLVIFEYLITFGTEVQLFWGRKVTGASVFFFLNRYMRLLYVLFCLGSYSISACGGPYTYTWRTLILLDYIPWAGFSALRVFALTGGNWFLPPVVFMLSLAPLTVNFATWHWMTFVNDPIFGCLRELEGLSSALYFKFAFISRVPLIAADLIVIIVTWMATYRILATASRSALDDTRPTFSSLLLRDGTLYFIVMVSMNVLQVAFSTSPVLLSLDNDGLSYITQFSEPLSSILISRFMMNLQEAKQSTSGSAAASQSVSLVQFDRVVGSIGELLEPSITGQSVDYNNDNFAAAEQL